MNSFQKLRARMLTADFSVVYENKICLGGCLIYHFVLYKIFQVITKLQIWSSLPWFVQTIGRVSNYEDAAAAHLAARL